MRKLTTSTFITLDGVMQAPGGRQEDDTGEFPSGSWTGPYWDDMLDQDITAVLAKKPDLLLGRRTYQIFAASWPNATDPAANILNNARKYVVSSTLDKVDWNNSTLIKGDVVQEIINLKGQDGPEIQVHGSSNLIRTLLKHNLIDEMHLLIFPVVIGKGKRFFGEGTHPSGLVLLDSKISPKGVIIATYAKGGQLQTGSFG